MNLIVSGFNPAYVDWVCAGVIGLDPAMVKILSIAEADEMVNPDDLYVMGEDVARVKSDFEPPPNYKHLFELHNCQFFDENALF